MNITIENKKQKAIELMNKLNIYKPYIHGFETDNKVCFFENFGGFWAYQEPELMAKIKEIEKTYKVLVYAVTHEYLEFGECYDFFIFPITKTNGNTRLFRKKTFFILMPTFGTKPTTTARNSAQSVFARSVAALKGLCEVRYERI